ncbi:MAG: iron transporter [Planctomycetaceae bacterium]|nr:iron transporter [Planctomycetaceae bacterium]
MPKPRRHILTIIAPGILVAATGVGAGDLATGAFTGAKLGVAILWVVLLGAFLKFVLTEGLARYQLATGQTLLDGAIQHLGPVVRFIFLIYLLTWSVFVGAALMSATGVAAHAMFPVFNGRALGPYQDADLAKIIFGAAHSAVGVALVLLGGFKLFEKIMSVCIAVMFITVIVTAAMLTNDWPAVATGLVVPRIPDLTIKSLSWTVALMGGVGGTLTVLCYGYWIREKSRTTPADLNTCRIDLAVGYVFTALFGVAMVIIGSRVTAAGKGANLVVDLADQLQTTSLGKTGRWVFLIGAWGALFSSLLGVWQSVPYVFADFINQFRARRDPASDAAAPVDPRNRAYRAYLFAIAIVPMIGLFISFKDVQKYYAVFGACFMPMLAVALLLLNGRAKWIDPRYRNRPLTIAVLALTILLFIAAVAATIQLKFLA